MARPSPLPPADPVTPAWLVGVRVLLAVAYPLLAHWASHRGSGEAAAFALVDLMLIVLLGPLAARRPWAWVLLAALISGLAMLASTPWLQLLLLAPPMLFTALLAWWFGRSLRAPREALISRIVGALDGCEPSQLPSPLYRYTRRLTAAWSLLLATLSLTNGLLAVIAVPGGVLVRLGHPPLFAVAQQQWSLFANLLNYGIVGGFFVAEYVIRRRLFPHRPYRNFVDFMRRMGALGPDFWRKLFS
ncbi:ketosynthase [Lysobacter psychrotolerans]|uniref:Ketosynthase n=1 Tax=Montanilutibacter psychrotolerans TaxID=1327343 RepID=A0A3M8SRK8_9GAMM|nr:ketosynthase [Lysobacter psychrotolerans]